MLDQKKTAGPRTEGAPALQKLADAALLDTHDRILCYGCGYGADVSWFRARKFTVHGYDPHPPFGFAELPSGKFDWVFLIYLMNRLKTEENRRAAIARAAAYVRPGGYLAVVTRHGGQWAAEVEMEGREGALAYFQRILGDGIFDEARAMDFETEDRACCLLFRRGGAYRPRNPVDWIDDQESMATVCALLRGERLIGLDVETTLVEPRTLCTIQLGTSDRTFVIDALAMRDLQPVKALMEDDAVAKVIHNAQFEEQMFARHGIRIHNIFDTLLVSRKKHRKGAEGGHKLGEVCERELGIYLDKTLQTSDWTTRPLSPEQLAYAAVDAEVLVDLHRVFTPPPPPQNLSLFTE